MTARGTSTEYGERTGTSTGNLVILSRWRIYVLLFVCLAAIGGVAYRLVDVQVVQRDYLTTLAQKEISKQVTLQPSRGRITDRLGNVLAMDVDRESLWVVPSDISAERAPRLALTLAPMLNLDSQELLDDLTDQDYYWQPVARWLDPSTAEQIAALEEPGLRLIYEPRRIYPQEDFAAHIIGAVNHNGNGISGVESFYNEALKGITGTMEAEFDPARNPIAIAPQEMQPARNGADLVLTLDPLIQHVVEQELHATVEETSADGGTVIVLDPSTGAVRGMASLPTFNPNRYTDYPADLYSRNPAISNVYEPGSTFKMFTVAAGLQSGAFTADTLVNDTGTIYRYGYWLKNWNAGSNGMITPGGVIYHSSNVGALLLNELTGPEQFYHTINAFGFGMPTGIDLGGEEQGIVNDTYSPNYDDLTFLTNAYGQGISVTPLQMVQAAGALANDGILMQPYVVEQRCQDGLCQTIEPISLGRVVDPGVAWTVRRMLVHSANHYAPVVWLEQTGSYADQWLVPGYEVCAKTGTASIPLPGGGYDPSYTIGSVLGFAPAEETKYVVLVKVDRPKNDIWGVRTAVPLFYRVVEQLMRHERLSPDPQLFSAGQ
jgi:cell division protein FtsI (penicillin-binding protein 3)